MVLQLLIYFFRLWTEIWSLMPKSRSKETDSRKTLSKSIRAYYFHLWHNKIWPCPAVLDDKARLKMTKWCYLVNISSILFRNLDVNVYHNIKYKIILAVFCLTGVWYYRNMLILSIVISLNQISKNKYSNGLKMKYF